MIKEKKVSHLFFNMVLSSEEIEFYRIKHHIEGEQMKFKEIMGFIRKPGTKIKVAVNNNGKAIMFAHNNDSNKTLKIDGLGDHFYALLKTIVKANSNFEAKERGENPVLLTHEFITMINEQLLFRQREEVGIGKYRTYDFWGRPANVFVTSKDDNGRERPSKCMILERSEDGNIEKKMTELIDDVNNKYFKSNNPDDMLRDAAKFHARYVQIHPFRDGNGRTARILTNYLLLSNGFSAISIPSEERELYLKAIDYADAPNAEIFCSENSSYHDFYKEQVEKYGERNDENKYNPLIDLFKEYSIEETPEAVFYKSLNSEIYAEEIELENSSQNEGM